MVWQTNQYNVWGIYSNDLSPFSFDMTSFLYHENTLLPVIFSPTFWLLEHTCTVPLYTNNSFFFFQIYSHSYPTPVFIPLPLFLGMAVPWGISDSFPMMAYKTKYMWCEAELHGWESFETEFFWDVLSSSKFLSFPFSFPCVLTFLRFCRADV